MNLNRMSRLSKGVKCNESPRSASKTQVRVSGTQKTKFSTTSWNVSNGGGEMQSEKKSG